MGMTINRCNISSRGNSKLGKAKPKTDALRSKPLLIKTVNNMVSQEKAILGEMEITILPSPKVSAELVAESFYDRSNNHVSKYQTV